MAEADRLATAASDVTALRGSPSDLSDQTGEDILHVPEVDIFADTHETLSQGWWAAMKADAVLEGKCHALRAEFNARIRGTYLFID